MNYQSQEKGCGFASIKNLGYLLTRRKDYLFAFEPEIDKAPSLMDLKLYAASLGLFINGYRCKALPKAKKKNSYCLALTRKDNLEHMVAVKINRKSFVIYDSISGKYRCKPKEFYKYYSNIYFVCEEIDFSKNFPVIKKSVSKAPSIVLSSIVFASSVAFYLGLSGIFPKTRPPLNIPFFAGSSFIVFFILFSFVFEKRFDKKYREALLKTRISKRESRFAHYYKFRNLSLFAWPRFSCLASICLIASFHFSYSGWATGFVFSLCLIIELGLLSLLKTRFQRQKEEVSEIERSVIFCNEQIDIVKKRAKKLDQTSSKFNFGVCLSALSFLGLGLAFCLVLQRLAPSLWPIEKSVSVYASLLALGFACVSSLGMVEELKREKNYFLFNFVR